MKKVLFVSSEAVPFIKTGGLADVVGSLPKYFDENKYDVVYNIEYMNLFLRFTISCLCHV